MQAMASAGALTIAGRYTSLRPLAARVYDVLDLATGERRALKWTTRFPAPGVRMIAHPNLVAITDAGDVDGAPFVVMDLVHGVALERHLRAPIPPSLARDLLGQVCDAIEHLHVRGLVHGKLSVDTIMVTDQTSGSRWRTIARLLDWGTIDPAATQRADVLAIGRLAQALMAAMVRFDEATPAHAAIERTLDRLVSRARSVGELRVALEALFGRLG